MASEESYRMRQEVGKIGGYRYHNPPTAHKRGLLRLTHAQLNAEFTSRGQSAPPAAFCKDKKVELLLLFDGAFIRQRNEKSRQYEQNRQNSKDNMGRQDVQGSDEAGTGYKEMVEGSNKASPVSNGPPITPPRNASRPASCHRFFDDSSFRPETTYYPIRKNNPFKQAETQQMRKRDLALHRPRRLRAEINPAAEDHLRPCHRYKEKHPKEKGLVAEYSRRTGQDYSIGDFEDAISKCASPLLNSLVWNALSLRERGDGGRSVLKRMAKGGIPASQKELKDRQLMPPPKFSATQLRAGKALLQAAGV